MKSFLCLQKYFSDIIGSAFVIRIAGQRGRHFEVE
jgi:hypothetical protein